MINQFRTILESHGITIGLSASKDASGTWEWYQKATAEF